MEPTESRDLKLRVAYKPFQINLSASELSSPACIAAYETYLGGINRAAKILEAAAFASYTADVKRHVQDTVYLDLFGIIKPTQNQVEEHREQIDTAFEKLLLEKFSSRTVREIQDLADTLMISLDRYVAGAPDEVRKVYQGLLKSIILEAWTAIEIMFGDLWEMALNEHPHQLSLVSLPERVRIQIQIQEIHDHGFDLRNKMGTILRKNFHFSTAAERKKAYAEAFMKKSGQEVANISSDENFDALFHIRNLIAHNSGVIDQAFIDKTHKCLPLDPIRKQVKGHSIWIDGDFVREWILPAINKGFDLIRAVDKWISKHPQHF